MTRLLAAAVRARTRFVPSLVTFALIAGLFPSAVAPLLGEEQAPPAKQLATQTFRLADGTELPIKQWPETYDAIEWQTPLTKDDGATIYKIAPSSWYKVCSVAFDREHHKVYWAISVGGMGAIHRANYDGTGHEEILKKIQPPQGERDLMDPRGLCVLPAINKLYWTDYAGKLSALGFAVFTSTLDGNHVESFVPGLHNCECIEADELHKKVYWNDDSRIQRANLDFSQIEDIAPRADCARPFCVDFSRGDVYSRAINGIKCESIDGHNKSLVFKNPTAGFPHSEIVVDGSAKLLYWGSDGSIVRAPISSPQNIELIVDGGGHFAIDEASSKICWTADNNQRLLIASLPRRWPITKSPAPPVIESLSPPQLAAGGELIVKGEGLQTTSRVFWIGYPGGQTEEAEWHVNSDMRITTKAPQFREQCRQAVIVVLADGGATVTVPRNTTAVRRVLIIKRASVEPHFTYIVQDRGRLEKVEHSVAVVEAGGLATSDNRGGNTFLVKNGGALAGLNFSELIIHEPHAIIPGLGPNSRRIAVGAIRPSYVETLVELR